MASIKDIEGIGPLYATKLADAGVKTTEKLLDVAASKKGREELASATGISAKQLLEFVNRADLFRIKGIGEEFSDLLEAAGVDSPGELGQRNAANLHKALTELNESKKLVRQVPSEAQIEGFIDQAKKLDKVVTH